MRLSAVRGELPNVMAVQCPHDADPREHRRAAKIGYQHQRLDGGLPFWRIMLALRQLRDEGGGIVRGDQLAAIRQRDGIIECARQPLSG
ncbi:hypothetical protein QCM77_45790, partial [Bradyrhizobium sp. SSUT18]|uniref:hypothetical protein n=1 Tax=Bradyrhizobium sp. SSUT18 TaxID=3040602 RepID=UPI00244821DA